MDICDIVNKAVDELIERRKTQYRYIEFASVCYLDGSHPADVYEAKQMVEKIIDGTHRLDLEYNVSLNRVYPTLAAVDH